MRKTAIIIGAGPAGLTAAYELLKRTDILPIILEKSGEIGGISRTINFKGNRMDMGPHRFFSKSDRVMDWWLKIMPLQEGISHETTITYQNKSRPLQGNGTNQEDRTPGGQEGRPLPASPVFALTPTTGGPEDKGIPITPATEKQMSSGVDSADCKFAAGQNDAAPAHNLRMLLIQRLTRIYFLRKFFAYPIKLSLDTLRAIGLIRAIKIMLSFLWIQLFPRKPEKSLEDFIINKFGRQLYLLFFKDYTEKVWGIAPSEISAEWGAQRIKGVSFSKAIAGAIKSLHLKKKKSGDINQKDTETSLIEQFLYPKYGPGSLWEEVARQVQEMGGKIYLHQDVQTIYTYEGKIHSVTTINSQTGLTGTWEGNYFFSTMPVQELIAGIGAEVPLDVKEVAAGLQYRDFINVGILLKQLSTKEGKRLELKDNWIYIQERDVKVGRLMIYNNWGSGMIKDPNTTWIGMEYFCNKTDAFWALDDETIQAAAIRELEKMDLAQVENVLDITVRRMEKTYPAYFGTYSQFDKIKAFTDQFANLFLVGRNGMHKYNNADHSMLTAMVAVDNIASGITTKTNLWSINTEQEYHEEKSAGQIVSQKTYNGEKTPMSVLTPTSTDTPTTTKSPAAAQYSFLVDYLWKNRAIRALWIVWFSAFLLQFIIFKFRYPYANYMPDSYSYLEAAYTNADVNMWPVAYSKFLRLLSVFTHSDKLVVGFQYLFLQGSSLLFLLTIIYFLKPGKVARNILYVFLVCNPVPLYVANYISADALFAGLSLLWITSLLWIIYQPRLWQIGAQATLLLACFTVRYNAFYYPLISVLAFLLSKQRWKTRFAGIGLSGLLILASFYYTSQKMLAETGRKQFSAFGGWQFANNALYMYQHIPARDRAPVPSRFAKLEKMVREHMDTLNKVKFTGEDSASTFFYLWSGRGPLIQYLTREWKKDSTTPYFKRWAAEGPLYADYAAYLIRKYPVQFAEYFLYPNALKYVAPPAEFLRVYNMGGDSVGKLAKDWFNYKSRKVKEHDSKDKEIIAVAWFPVFSSMVNILIPICIAGIFVFGGIRKKNINLFRLVLLIVIFWAINMGFSIFASPVVLRYQVYPTTISFTLCVLMTEFILQQDSDNFETANASNQTK